MFALIYLLAAFLLGDAVCRRFFSFTSIQHRLAAAFLTGLLFSTCFTYLAALLFAGTGHTLLGANVLFFLFAAVVIFLLERENLGRAWLRSFSSTNDNSVESVSLRPPGNWKLDLAFIGVCFIFGCWLFFSNLNFIDGSFNFAIKSWSDFGANLSLTQSLAVGDNYPTVHPFYPSETVRYHFLFWFLAANLSYLGLNVVWAINILSLLSLLALIVLMMTFAEVLFNSRAVGRISAILFFFASSSLSYLPYLRSQESFGGAITSIIGQKDFLRSGFPYRGDDWGALSVAVFSNQRQLISAVGIVLVVLIFLVQFYRRKGAMASLPDSKGKFVKQDGEHYSVDSWKGWSAEIGPFIFCGVLIGVLPYWNSAVFVAAVIIIGSLFVLFPKRHYLVPMIATIVITGLPQILMLRSGNLSASGQSLFKWGYIVADPTIFSLLEYIAWTFGFKLFLIAAAVWLVPNSYRRFFLALSAPFFVVFLLQLSTDVFNNHKLLNIWTTLTTVYIAYAIWFIAKKGTQGIVFAVVLTLLTFFGAVIDLFPIHNDAFVKVPYHNDRLTTWMFENTNTSDIFLTDTLLSHPILMSGRKIYLGNTLFAWTAGYDLAERERTHRKLFKTIDPDELMRLLYENHIAYVAIDDSVRGGELMRGLSESVFQANLEKVFDDKELKYGNLKIYKVPPQQEAAP